MRILISVLAILVVGLFATQAKADLVDDLRSGRSDIKAADASAKSNIDYYRHHKKLQNYGGYKAVAVKSSPPWGSSISYGHNSAEAAVKAAVSKCESENVGKCAVFSIGSQVVVDFSKRELADAIALRSEKTVYCKKNDGTVYRKDVARVGACLSDSQITKVNYDYLKNKKTVTASKSTGSYVHCRRSNGTVYKKDVARVGACLSDLQITKAYYDYLTMFLRLCP